MWGTLCTLFRSLVGKKPSNVTANGFQAERDLIIASPTPYEKTHHLHAGDMLVIPVSSSVEATRLSYGMEVGEILRDAQRTVFGRRYKATTSGGVVVCVTRDEEQ